MSRPNPTSRERFQSGVARAVSELGGDRSAEEMSGVSKSVWYDAKKGRAVPDEITNWPAMRDVLATVAASRTGVADWDRLYEAVLVESGRPRRTPPVVHASVGDGGTRSRPPRQLPPGPGVFAARIREISLLNKLLRDDPRHDTVPIAVVVGQPGVGKTALAVTWAHRFSEDYPDGVLYADLRGWGPDEPVAVEEQLPAWLRVLGMSPETIPDDNDARSAALRTVLDGRRMLLVLDNARTEDQVRPLLPGTSSCAVLITCRNGMPGLAIHQGAGVVRLGLLTADESRVLLRDLVGRRVDEEPRAAAELVELCGHLPLALRVVAESARARDTVTLASLVAELVDVSRRLDHLDSDDPRSDTRTVFSWSYAGLTDDAAEMFRLLGLFPGRFVDANSAAALAGIAPAVAGRRLRALQRAHLVEEIAGERFTMHDLLRLYAMEVAVRDESEFAIADARQRLLDYFLHTAWRADELVVPQRYRVAVPGATPISPPFHDHDGALAWLDAEHGNAVALCGLDVAELDDRRWRLAFLLRGYFFLTKRVHEWIVSHESALAAATRCGDRLGVAMTHSNLGVALHERGDDEAAMRHYESAQRLFDEIGDHHGVSNALAHRAVIYRRRGEYERSLDLSTQALGFYRAAGSLRNVAITLRGIALVEIELGRIDAAEEHLVESLGICADLRMDMDSARSRSTLGRVLLMAGRLEQAERTFRDAVTAGQECGSEYEEGLAHWGLGQVAVSRGHDQSAERHFETALGLLESVGAAKADQVRAELADLVNRRRTRPSP
ncbi:transcriptional regulator, SARP family [Alloactinosynnema sp. L-07]|uniref:ATP-binding protein n=1 Tax=Alloactinosynnema sp. L-07 TaxID=1653480 RepID=UPI00065EFF16|nr:tetratricopeptide repeat protein [Alloactinosynnema sp. L-07]CRK57683.1 transcriptional regulator, SARP family [Alloactinosynnema sp. L-07]